MKKIIALFMSLFFLLGITTTSFAVEAGTNIVDMSILSKMDAIHNSNMSNAKSASSSDSYGGIYYKNGKIVLLTTENANISKYKADSDIIIEHCDYTYAELETAWQTIADRASEIPNFVSVGIAPKRNRVVLTVENKAVLKQDELSWLPTGLLEIAESNPIKPTATIGCGDTMKNATRNSTSSCCVGVRTNSGINGLIIQGHETLVNDTIKNASNQTIGSVTQRVQNTTSVGPDACFVTLTSGNSVTNTIPEITGANTVVAGQTFSVYAGLPVHMRGKNSRPFSSGEVDEVSVQYQWTEDRDGLTHYYIGAKATYLSKVGDSGGIVFVYTNLGPIWAGVQSGGGETVSYSVFAKATDIASYFGCSVS